MSKKEKHYLEYQKELLQIQFQEVENLHKEMKIFRHDFKNHIQSLIILNNNKEFDKVNEYLNNLNNEITKIDTVVKTGNIMCDAILNSKINLAKGKGINVVCDAAITIALSTSEVDLCVIIGNLMDNAIEASLQSNEKLIRIYMTIKNTQLYMSFTNFTKSKKQIKNKGIFKTSKGVNRGYGLISIDKLVEKYNGYLSRNSEDDSFTTEILLPQVL